MSECDKRKCIVEGQDEDGKWQSFAYMDLERQHPVVFSCSCQAKFTLTAVLRAGRYEALQMGMDPREVVKAESDFRITHVDVEPPEPVVTSTDQADDLLDQLRKRGVI